jgi:hypothetical protein
MLRFGGGTYVLGRLRAHEDGDWCSDIMTKKLGNGGSTRFWLDKSMGHRPLCETFPRLFSVSCQTDNYVSQMGEW